MKKHFLFSILCLIPFLAFSQKKSIDGFLDISFGSDSATVKAAMTTRGAVRDTQSKRDLLVYNNFIMSDRKVAYAFFYFLNNKAYEAFFVFTSDFTENDIFSYYDNFSSDITAVYGKGEMTNNFVNNNSINLRRLKEGNASCKTDWVSKNKNAIELSFRALDHQDVQIILDYQDTELYNMIINKRRSDL
jgi:hypothetical protein